MVVYVFVLEMDTRADVLLNMVVVIVNTANVSFKWLSQMISERNININTFFIDLINKKF